MVGFFRMRVLSHMKRHNNPPTAANFDQQAKAMRHKDAREERMTARLCSPRQECLDANCEFRPVCKPERTR